MEPFIHLHVHTQYSLLDGQASIDALINKAYDDGMRAIAVTDHGNMFGIKEFFNKVNKKNGKVQGTIKDLQKELKTLGVKEERTDEENARLAEIPGLLEKAKGDLFKPIIGCECYCARNHRLQKTEKEDRSGWHLIVLAKNMTGYKNLIKIVSQSWTEGFYGRPRIDKELLEQHREGLIVCSACLGGEIPQKIMHGNIHAAEEAVLWFKQLFGEDYYLELQRHETHRADADQTVYKHQVEVNKVLIELAHKHGVKIIATNDVHFVNEEDADAHDRLICLSTGKDLNDPNRMRYTKQEWMKTTAEMNQIFGDVPDALRNTLEIADKVEFYSIDSGPIMPTFNIPADFGTEEGYRQKLTEQDLFDEFTRDENGNVVLSQADAEAKIKKLGGYDKLYRIKLEADYLAKISYEGAKKRYGDPLDEYINNQMFIEGRPWGASGTQIGSLRIDGSTINSYRNWFWGHEFTSTIVGKTENISELTLNERPSTAAGYCYIKNKRNADGTVTNPKWYLPGIRELERILEDYYIEYTEFQNNYYWSSAAGEVNVGIFFDRFEENQQRARATKAYIGDDGKFHYYESGDGHNYIDENSDGGAALRTQSLRIRAARIDTDPQ